MSYQKTLQIFELALAGFHQADSCREHMGHLKIMLQCLDKLQKTRSVSEEEQAKRDALHKRASQAYSSFNEMWPGTNNEMSQYYAPLSVRSLRW